MSIWSPCLSLPRAGNTNLHHVTCTPGTHFQMNKNCAGGSMQMPPSPAVMYYFLLWERQDVTHWSPVLSLAVIWISISNSLVLQDIKYLYIQGDYPKLVAHVCHIAKVHEDTDICDFKRIILVFFFQNSIWVILLAFMLLWHKQQRGFRPRLTVQSILYCGSFRSPVAVSVKKLPLCVWSSHDRAEGKWDIQELCGGEGTFRFFLGWLRMFCSLGPRKLFCVKPWLTYFQGIVTHPLWYLSWTLGRFKHCEGDRAFFSFLFPD